MTHKKICIRGGHTRSHRGPPLLMVNILSMFKEIILQNEFKRLQEKVSLLYGYLRIFLQVMLGTT